MVYLNRIYTKTGDDGHTALGDGTRVPKTHPRIQAYGGVDELNSVLGLVLTTELPAPLAERLQQIQNDLFDVGADLCVPVRPDEDSAEHPPLRLGPEPIERMENWIDAANERLKPLTSFILPGGTATAAHLHHARTVCRRAETGVVALAQQEPVNAQVQVYLNRLSDLLFVWARLTNDEGRADVLWKPQGK